MKFATIALIATVSASTAAFKATAVLTKCPALTAAQKKSIDEAKKATAEEKKEAAKLEATANKEAADLVTSTEKDLTDCYTKNKIAKADQVADKMTADKCGAEWNAHAAAANAAFSAKCLEDAAKGSSDTGMIIGIVVGVVCCLGITGFLIHRHNKNKNSEGGSGDAFSKDDLYHAFVDNETA